MTDIYDRLDIISDRIFKAFNHPKVNAAVGLFILAVASFFAGAIYAQAVWN